MAKKSQPTKVASKVKEAAIIATVAQLNANYRLGHRLNQGTAPDSAELQSSAVHYPGGVGYSNRRKMQQLARKVTKENWAKLMKLRLKKSRWPLTWSHLAILASAPTWDSLKQSANLAAKESWSSEKLRRHLQRNAGTINRRPGTGRMIGAPDSVAEGLQMLLTDLEVVRKRTAALRELLRNQAGPSGLADNLIVLEKATEAIRTYRAINV
jgi:hypothetical protein